MSIEPAGFDLGKFILDGIPYRYDETAEPKLIMDPATTKSTITGSTTTETPTGVLSETAGVAKDFGEADGKERKLAVTEAEAEATFGKGYTQYSEEYIRAHPWESDWWYFDKVAHRVVKTVRIGYTAMQDGKPIERHILIGYEGVDGMG